METFSLVCARGLFCFNNVNHTTPLAKCWQVGDTVGVSVKAIGYIGGWLEREDFFPVLVKLKRTHLLWLNFPQTSAR